MKRYAERIHGQTLTEINVTPLLDLAFVLLIIFMITTPLIENRMDLIVPTSTAAEGAVDPEDVRIIAIDRSLGIELEEQPVSPVQLEEQLRAMFSANPETAVVIRPDKTIPIQEFISVMDIVQKAGITRVGVMTRPEGPTP